MTASVVLCQHLHKQFSRKGVVEDVSFSVAEGEILALVGPSGCGKTTTLRLIAGFEELDSGRIQIDREEVAAPGRHLPPEKRRAGIVFQDYAIFPHLSVAENIGFGLPRRERQARVAEMLRFVGLDELGARMPHTLSGGQQQRVALARALAPKPVVLLLDEPFSNLDAALRGNMRTEVRGLLRASGTTAIFVTHDQEEALYMGDRIAVMQDGRLVQIDTPERVFHQPRNRFVAEFMGQADFLPGTVTAGGIETPLGVIAQASPYPAGTAVEIVVRADDVLLAEAEGGNGRIIDRQFIGIAFIYTIALTDGIRLRCWQPHEQALETGATVHVSLAPTPTLPHYPRD